MSKSIVEPGKSRDQLIIVDSHALVHRAYHAFPPLTTSEKELVNAVYGFTMMLLNSIQKYGPEYIACAFDEKGPTFRKKKFVGYKANRPKTDKELKDQMGRVREVVGALNIPQFSEKGFEADDVIGSIVQQYLDGKFGDKNLELVIVTGDKDLLQLLDKNVYVSLPGRSFSSPKIWQIKDFEKKYGFSPELFIDYKGLKGDSSDNIPGIKGVGDKTATELIKEFGTVEKIFEKLDKVPEKFQKKLKGNKEVAEVSKDLATIVRDVPLKFDLEACRVSSYDRSKTLELFQELDFSSLVKLLPEVKSIDMGIGSAPKPKQAGLGIKAGGKKAKDVKSVKGFNFEIVDDKDKCEEMLKDLEGVKEVVIDAESDKLEPMSANLVGFSIADAKTLKKVWHIPSRVSESGGGFEETAEKQFGEALAKKVKAIIESDKILKVGHNLKFDKHIFKNEGIEMKGLYFDTMIAAYLLDPGERGLGLKSLAFNKIGIEMSSFEETFTNKPDLYSEDIETLAKYCCMDSYVTGKLKNYIGKELAKIEKDTKLQKGLVNTSETGLNQKDWSLFHEVEMPLVDILVGMEREGIRVDTNQLEKLSTVFGKEVDTLTKRIHEAVGHEFNPASSQQLAEVLFKELNLPNKKKTKTGYSTSDSVLRKLVNAHPVVPLIREFREVSKLKSTYVDGLLKLVDSETQRVHTSFNQVVTATGRLSSSNPNLQNIPTKAGLGEEIRRCFVAEKNYALVSLDYSQVELRVMAHVSKDPNLIEIFKKGLDIHKSTASVIFGVPVEKVTKKQRRVGKTVNFAVMYGMSEYGLSDLLEIPQSKAKEYIERFFDKFPGIRDYFDGVIEGVKERGYVETMFGRRRNFTYGRGYHRIRGLIREANNTPMQGSAADIMKIAMIAVDKTKDEFGFEVRPLVQVHDEILFEVELKKKLGAKGQVSGGVLERLYTDKNLQEFVPKMIDVMENVVKLSVPLDVDAEIGLNWADKTEVEKDDTEE